MPTTSPIHFSVLQSLVVDLIQPDRGGIYIDCTLGLGGHAEALLARAQAAQASITLYGLDQDQQALAYSKERLGDQVLYIQANFANLADVARQEHIKSAAGILMDIGVSSYQLDVAERGFSFMREGPLDMRMDQDADVSAADIVNGYSERDLANIIFQLGEERLSRKIARVVVQERGKQAFTTTTQLADVIARCYPPALRHRKPHPATRTFQALRMAVNEELDVLKEGMEAALSLLAPGGVLVIISFHSLEDRIVKTRFREAAQTEEFRLLTKKPLMPSEQEVGQNTRSRSAKLRAIQKKPALG